MAKQRLLNCDFINDSAFIDDTSNKAKLLYLIMFVNADDLGFVGNAKNIVDSLQKNDTEFRNEINLELLANDYVAALDDLVGKGLIYEFTNNHQNKIYLIRHWWYHNKYKKGLWTNYYKYYQQVEIVDNEYVLKKSKTKENNKLNQIKLNQNKDSSSNDNNVNEAKTENGVSKEEWDELFDEEQEQETQDNNGLPF